MTLPQRICAMPVLRFTLTLVMWRGRRQVRVGPHKEPTYSMRAPRCQPNKMQHASRVLSVKVLESDITCGAAAQSRSKGVRPQPTAPLRHDTVTPGLRMRPCLHLPSQQPRTLGPHVNPFGKRRCRCHRRATLKPEWIAAIAAAARCCCFCSLVREQRSGFDLLIPLLSFVCVGTYQLGCFIGYWLCACRKPACRKCPV